MMKQTVSGVTQNYLIKVDKVNQCSAILCQIIDFVDMNEKINWSNRCSIAVFMTFNMMQVQENSIEY